MLAIRRRYDVDAYVRVGIVRSPLHAGLLTSARNSRPSILDYARLIIRLDCALTFGGGRTRPFAVKCPRKRPRDNVGTIRAPTGFAKVRLIISISDIKFG